MIQFILKILRCFRPLFGHLGINFEQMAAIISVKLTIDNRIEKNGKSSGKTNHTLIKQAIFMAIIGGILFILPYFLHKLSALLFFHSYLCIMVITSFMTEYSRLLFNTNDNHILERFPVDDRTLLSARILSMLSYLYLITFSLALLPFILLLVKEGPGAALIFLAANAFNTLFSLLLANLFYIGLMRFISVEKFQRITMYIQSTLIILVAFSYQLLTPLLKTKPDLDVHPALWTYFTPPCYFAAFNAFCQTFSAASALQAGTGIVLTLLLFILTITSFSKHYVQKASALDKVYGGRAIRHKEKLANVLARLCCRESCQQAGFKLTWRMTRDNLKFKQSIIPMILYALIFNAYPLYQSFSDSYPLSVNSLITSLYILPVICLTIIMNLNYADENKVLWIYQSRPLQRPGAILLGSFKAVYFKYLFPFFMLVYLLYAILGGTEILDDLLLCFSSSTLFILLYYRWSEIVFPFSKERNTQQSGSFMIKFMGALFLLTLMGVLHHFLRLLPFGVFCAGIICWIPIYFTVNSIATLSWNKILSHY